MSIKRFIQQEDFFHYYQPIFNLKSGEEVGCEGLLRSNVYSNPEMVFLEARKEKWLYELDSRSIHKAIYTYHMEGARKEGNLFLNIFPSTILNQHFPSLLTKIITDNDLSSEQIVLEIIESEIIKEFSDFKIQISELKKQGFLIAIDDIGQGYNTFKSIIELEPDYLKFDRYFAKDLHISNKKQKLMSLFLNYCKQEKSHVILEGIETEKEMGIAQELGVELGQGFLLGKPGLLKG